MTTNKNESYWHNSSVQAIGVMMVLLLVLPTVIRRVEGQWAGIDWVVLTTGSLVVIAWCVGMSIRALRRRHGSEVDRAA